MLNKKKGSADPPSDMELLQQGDDLDSLLDSSMLSANKNVVDEQHESVMGAVDDLMNKYDKEEKNVK